MKNVTVCFISHSSNLGGAERSLLELMDILKEAKLITPYVILPSKGPIEELLKQRNIPYKIISFESWVSVSHPVTTQLFRTIRNNFKAKKIAKQIREWNCKLVFSNTLTISVGALAAMRLKLPHIWQFREYGSEHHSIKFDLGMKRALRFIESHTTLLLANSKGVQNKYQKLLKRKKVQLIYNPIIIDEDITISKNVLDTFNKDSFNFVTVGFLQPQKKQEDAIRAIQQCLDAGHNVSLTLVGGVIDSYYQYLLTLIQKKHLSKIHFTKNVQNPLEYIKAADGMIFASQFESYSRVIIEAFRLKTPVIASRSGGNIEQIIHNETGLLYEPGNSNDLVESIKQLCRDKSKATQLSQNAYSWVSETCTKNVFSESFKRVLRDLTY